MNYVTLIINQIQQHILDIEGEYNYKGWVVVLSWKEFQQFKYDTIEPIINTVEINNIDNNYYDELINTLNDAGIEVIIEQNPTIIYLYKRLVN